MGFEGPPKPKQQPTPKEKKSVPEKEDRPLSPDELKARISPNYEARLIELQTEQLFIKKIQEAYQDMTISRWDKLATIGIDAAKHGFIFIARVIGNNLKTAQLFSERDNGERVGDLWSKMFSVSIEAENKERKKWE